ATGPRKIAVIGPNADSWRNQIGDYAYPCHIETLKSMKEDDPFGTPVPDDVEDVDDDASVRTILEGIRAYVKEERGAAGTVGTTPTDLPEITYARGCDVLDTDRSGFAEAVSIASEADLVILAMGDRAGLVEGCTTGEARDRATLGLPGVQEELLREVAAAGTPVVLVLLNGRPVALPEVEPLVKAILLAWLPGEEGGSAVAEALFGITNPGGKLPISFPRDVGQVPVFYGHKPSGGRSHWLGSYVEMSTTPFYAFGHGLSYTTFSYDALTIEGKTLSQRDRLRLSVDVTNTGSRDGDEVVQLYIRDEEYTITRPVKELKGFARVSIPAGETRRVTFDLSTDQLGFHGKDLNYIIEPGTFRIMVGSGSEDIRLTDTIEIVGDTRHVRERDAYFTAATVGTPIAGTGEPGSGTNGTDDTEEAHR
ncbi:MAG: glycoside hydrolase family 3 C-terminal domain-containing protein, partial [Alkalispirochaeta sp.]